MTSQKIYHYSKQKELLCKVIINFVNNQEGIACCVNQLQNQDVAYIKHARVLILPHLH